ncbi:MAG TPA: 50S ribosomal protein L13 [Phycisphaerales bacterium]|nr:50S ribosomal protein L13 [Phycisphaerales bacterium]HMP38477.1 50S ribosomal protein L13 [Phycisphaerales bacterium]
MPRQTTLLKKEECAQQTWRHVDAEGKVLGRLASEIAQVLMGKHLPTYTPHVLSGEAVVVTNAKKVVLTGKKLDQKTRRRWSGYPGGLRVQTYRTVQEAHPERLIEDAVRRMLPKGRLGRRMFGNLHVYAGPQHPHRAQQPEPMAPSRRIAL